MHSAELWHRNGVFSWDQLSPFNNAQISQINSVCVRVCGNLSEFYQVRFGLHVRSTSQPTVYGYFHRKEKKKKQGSKQPCCTSERTATHKHTPTHCSYAFYLYIFLLFYCFLRPIWAWGCRDGQNQRGDWMRKRWMLWNERRPEWKGKTAYCYKWIATCWQLNDTANTSDSDSCWCVSTPPSLLD